MLSADFSVRTLAENFHGAAFYARFYLVRTKKLRQSKGRFIGDSLIHR